MVIEGDDKRLAGECDGDRWHPIEMLADDMARQAILEHLGWKITRIRESAFFRDEEQAMRPVFERLDELGIAPGFRDDGSVEDDSLIQEIEAIVAEFHQDKGLLPSPLQPNGNGIQSIYLTEIPQPLAEVIPGLIGEQANF